MEERRKRGNGEKQKRETEKKKGTYIHVDN